MAINLDNFIHINISSGSSSSISTPNVVLIGTTDLGTYNNKFISKINFITDTKFTTGLAEDNIVKKYLKIYFDNNGKNIHYIYCNAIENFDENLINDSEIMLAYCGEYNASLYAKLVNLTGIKEKIYVTSYNSDTAPEVASSNTVYKYGELGVEMEILAYYSNFSIFNSRLNDYCFTEIYSDQSDTTIIENDTEFKSLTANNNLNVNIKLAGKVRNYGGNDIGAKDLTNNFIRIYMTQLITNNLITLLATKLVYNDTSINTIVNNINNTLNIFRDKGYLRQSAVWTGGDVMDESGNYLIIANNTILSTGYKITMLPLSTLNTADKAAHKLPTIYIYIADTYSIRQIEITGSII